MGGSALADFTKDMDNFWITRQEYEEKGIYALEKLGIKVGGKVRQKYSLGSKYLLQSASGIP